MREIRHQKCGDWSAYKQSLQFRRSLEANNANKTAIEQTKIRLVHRDSRLLDDAAFIRFLDEKKVGV
jgi:hypothetical protein